MASAPPAATEEITLSLPLDVVREIDLVAARRGLSRSALMTGAARQWLLGDRRWREVQASIAEQARQSGLHTEVDIEEYLDSLADDLE